MHPDRWQQLVSTFHDLHGKSEAERADALAHARLTDPDLAVELERMLEEENSADDFLEHAPLVHPATRQITPGDLIAHYRIRSLLGSGGMGIVYCAQDTRLNRLVALKFLAPHLVGYGEDRAQFVREAQAAAALHHANICPVYEIDEADGRIFIAMAFLQGESLAQKIATGPLPIKDAVELAIEIASGLQAAHVNGTIHHDIKPANLMVTAGSDLRNHATLMDFGLAQMTDRSRRTTDGLLAGTISYMSPERVSGHAVDHRTDLWSLGVVLFEMLTGQKPFAGSVDRVVLNAIVNQKPPSLHSLRPDAPQELERILTKALAKEPDRRYASATEFIRDLQQVSSQLEVSRANLAPASGARRWRSVRMVAMIIAMSVALTALFGLVWQRFTHVKEAVGRQITNQISDNRVTTATIAPDGKLLAYATVDGVFMQVVRTGDVHVLRSPKNFWVDRIRWFVDGDNILIGGFERTSFKPSIWKISIPGGEPILIREDARDPEPTQDGSRIAFTNGGRSELWISGSAGDGPRTVLAGAADRLSVLFWSGDANHLVFGRQKSRIERDPTTTGSAFVRPEPLPQYESINVSTGETAAHAAGLRITSAFALSRGRVVFLSPDSTNDAGRSLWELQTDSRTAAPLGKPRRLPVKVDWANDVSASADGSRITMVRVLSAPTLYVADWSASDLKISNLRRLTLDTRTSYPHSWSHDGRAVIFESDRRGSTDLYRQELDSRIAQSVVATPKRDFHPNLAPDGKWLLFAQSQPGYMLPASVVRVPVGGGVPEEVVASGSVEEFRCALPGGKRCVGRRTESEEWYRFYDLDPIHGVGRELTRTRWMPNIYGDWALSAQGTEVALPYHEFRSAKIRIVSLDPGTGPAERELAIEGLSNLRGLSWSVDDKGWFVIVATTVGNHLVYVDRSGHVTRLLEQVGYTVPSPDGKHLALMIPAVTTNVWSFEGF